jgi:hypothetical protein
MDTGPRAGGGLLAGSNEKRDEAKRRKDYKKKEKKKGWHVERIGITEHNPTQIFRKKKT